MNTARTEHRHRGRCHGAITRKHRGEHAVAQTLERGLMDIGSASKASGVNVARTYAEYRVYSANDVHTLRFIRRARELGFSMDDIEELLSLWQIKSRSSAAVKRIAGRHI